MSERIEVERVGRGRWSLTLLYDVPEPSIPPPPRDLGITWGKGRAVAKAVRRMSGKGSQT